MPIHCDIISQDREVYSGDADMVVIPGAAGMMGILPNHAPLLSTMQYGVVTVRAGGAEEHFTVAGGIVEVLPNLITILADAAENVAEIDEQRAETARSRASTLLAQGVPDDTDAYLSLQAALRRSTLRLDAVRRYRQGQRQRQ